MSAYVAANSKKLKQQKTAYYAANKTAQLAARDSLRKMRMQNPQPLPARKTCTICGLGKSFLEFGRNSYAPDGLKMWCKLCARKHRSQHRDENKTEILEREALFRDANRKRLRAADRKRYIFRRDDAPVTEVKVATKRCHKCKQIKSANDFWLSAVRHDGLQAMCKQCQLVSTSKEKRLQYQRTYNRANPEKACARVALRQARKLRAMATWSNPRKINAFYAKAKALTLETGIAHHVDHIIPLRSSVVCGLHCEDNLQILTGVENSKKNNRFDIF